ncbi:MAG: hypothetical protein J1F35_06375 [Erysipelotrichales bacterium]|nr:hypothetical protein [Erysipelotrichales bacterium]
MYNQYDDWNMDGIGGPNISGKWMNKRTGDTIFVRDSIIMDNSMSVMLSDGRAIDMEEFSRDYIQMSEEEYDLGGNQISSNNSNNNIINPGPGGVSGRYKDSNVIQTPPMEELQQPEYDFGNLQEDYYEEAFNTPPITQKKDSPNLEMIKKLFENTNPEISINISMETKNFPVNEINMLTNIFGVSPLEISEYIFNQYFNTENIIEAIKKYLSEKIGLKFENTEPKDPE